MSRGKIALVIIAIALAVLLGYRIFGGPADKGGGPDGPKADKGPVPVTVVPVEIRDVPVYLFAQGTVRAHRTANVRPQVGGLLLSLDFEEGQPVKKGQVLAEIDPRSYQATLDQAVARQKQDQAQLATAQSNLERSRDLYKKSYISQQDLTTLENTVQRFKAAVAADAAAVRDARLQVDYTKVRAPFDGQAGLRQVDPGNVIGTGDVIVTVTQIHPVNVMFSLPAGTLDAVRTAQAATPLAVAALDSTDQHTLAADGELEVIDNRIDAGSNTYRLKARFPNNDDKLWPGQFVKARLQVGSVEDGLVIPSQAVQRGPDGEFVYLLGTDNTVSMQPVVTGGDSDPSHSLISEGLEAGDKVVTEGMFRLKPGSKVTPLKPGDVPVATPSSSPGKPDAGGPQHDDD